MVIGRRKHPTKSHHRQTHYSPIKFAGGGGMVMSSFVTGPNEFSGLSNSASLAQRCHTPIFQRALDEQWIVGDPELADPVSQASAGRA